ncbi:MAG: Trx7/PDZ domain-containing (seleno)protein [Planctomycetaceae bacterium]
MWDGQVARQNADIQRMRRAFVCVRITRMNGVDFQRFEFDLDTTWSAFFTDSQLNIYSRFGGRDAGEPEDRLNISSLLHTMGEVLRVHQQRLSESNSNRQGTPPANPLLQPAPKQSITPRQIPLLAQSHQGCVHCHQIREYQFLQWSHEGVFSQEKLFGWPLPETLGLELDRNHGHRIQRLTADTPARQAGLRTGDVVERVGDVPVRSEYDIRWALHRLPNQPRVPVVVRRGTDRSAPRDTVQLPLPSGWRQTNLSWRKSLRSVPLELGFRGYALTRSQLSKLKLHPKRMAIRVTSVKDRGLAKTLKLHKRDIIVGVADRRARGTFYAFQSDLLGAYKPGDTVRLQVLRDGKPLTLNGKFPHWSTRETDVP